MPRLSEINRSGRDDLYWAIRRFCGVNRGGRDSSKRICKLAGLITYREWSYFEGLYDLLLELKRYLDQYHGGVYDKFPVVYHVKEKEGYELLHSLIQYYGGGNFVACKLGMTYRKKRTLKDELDILSADMNWGPFDLDFGIELLGFVRQQYLEMEPPLKNPAIEMPSKEQLLAHEGGSELGLRLHEQIVKFGGYESIARRLGLEV